MLKVTFPHDEAEHEHLGLQAWHGDGAVLLLRADPRRWALLLERLHADEDLTPMWDVEACEIVAGLYPRLHVPALPQLRRLSSYVDRWTARLGDLPTDAPCRDASSSRRSRSAVTSSATRPPTRG